MKHPRLFAVFCAGIAILAFSQSAFAYYHPTAGRWLQRDPAEYVDGVNQYEYVRSAPSLTVDPSGTKCSVCGAGIRYRVSIASLDAHQKDQGYSKAAKAVEGAVATNPGVSAQVNSWKLTFPKFESSGPVAVYNPEFSGPPRGTRPGLKFAQGTVGLALYLFFVDFEVCNPDDCTVEIYKTRHQQVYD